MCAFYIRSCSVDVMFINVYLQLVAVFTCFFFFLLFLFARNFCLDNTKFQPGFFCYVHCCALMFVFCLETKNGLNNSLNTKS